MEKAFKEFKLALTSLPMLGLTDFNKQFMVENGASNVKVREIVCSRRRMGRAIWFTTRLRLLPWQNVRIINVGERPLP